MKLTKEEREKYSLKISNFVSYEGDTLEITQTMLNIIDTILEEKTKDIKNLHFETKFDCSAYSEGQECCIDKLL